MTITVSSIASSATTPQNRLHQLTKQMAASKVSSFSANVVPQAPEDPLFGLMAAYRRDEDSNKVDLGIGAYRDNNAKPWVLPVVRKVRRIHKILETSLGRQFHEHEIIPLDRRHRPISRRGRGATSKAANNLAGKAPNSQRSRYQPRISSHRWPSPLHISIPEAYFW